jgi:hypothetical protein
VGVSLLQDPDGAKYEEARVQFAKAYELTKNWKVLGNLGLCALKLERDGEAIDAYEKYLAEGKTAIETEERSQIERDLAVLKAQVVSVRITLPKDGVTLVDERTDSRGNKIINEYRAAATSLELRLHPGRHAIAAQFGAGRVSRWDVDLPVAGSVEHTFELPAEGKTTEAPPPAAATPGASTTQPSPGPDATTRSRPIPTSVWITAGVTGALTLSAAVTGVMALDRRAKFNDVNDGAHSASEKENARSDAKSMSILSTMLTGGAVAGAALTGYFYFTRPERAERPTGHRQLLPWVGSNSAGVVLRGEL